MSETVSYQVIDEKSGEMSRNNSRKNVVREYGLLLTFGQHSCLLT